MITNDGYAAVPWYDEKYVILYNGEQISDVNSAAEAVAYIRNAQKASNPKALPKPRRQTKRKSVGRLTLDP
jgi:hypothetical protein